MAAPQQHRTHGARPCWLNHPAAIGEPFPRDLLVDILSSRLSESDPDLRTVELIDPRDA
jgi:hypothetical protein